MNSFVRYQLKKINGLLDRWMMKRAREFQIPASIEIQEDIPYLDDKEPCHRMDMYRSSHFAGPLPVIVNLHGGGMLLCTKAVNRPFCCELAKRGFLVFSLEYPLVPESDIPGILRDVARGMDKVAGLLERYGGDPERVYLVGDSAGAFINVYEAAAQKNRALSAAVPLRPSRLKIQALGLISGMYYTTLADSTGFYLRKDFYGKQWRRHPMAPFYQPHKPEVAGFLPPCYLITSRSDHLHGYTTRFHRGLCRAGTECALLDHALLKNLQHDFVIVKPEAKASQRAIDKMCEFLLKYKASPV